MTRKWMNVASVSFLTALFGYCTMVVPAAADTTLTLSGVTELGSSAGPFDLTAAGNLDWIAYGITEKAGGSAITGQSFEGVNGDASYPSFSYSDGVATTAYGTSSAGAPSLYLFGNAPSVSMSVPAGSGTITVWAGTGWQSNFSGAFADGTSVSYGINAGATNHWIDEAVMTYHTDVAQTFTWSGATVTGNTGVFAVAISTTSVPEPSTLVLGALAVVGLMAYAWRKRK